MIELPKLVLASSSPRRIEILTSVGWQFTHEAADIDEGVIDGELPARYVARLAREKAEAVASSRSREIVLGADTTVLVRDQMMGKPVDLEDARRMLRILSGDWHQVLTGIAIVRDGESRSAVQVTRVRFTEMTEAEIDFLAERGDPLDKAGAYAVQAQAALFIEKIEGDYWNVVGLPVSLVYRLIMEKAFGAAEA
ncbi:MAG TPA: Maf family protein [Pyrinomonadaceae bacterium]|nr:Maf family protein [Pyrinomonadaceae bacterium]